MTSQHFSGNLHTNVTNNIATIQFGHPASNSFPSELLDKLTNELHKISKNNNISVIILKSEGNRAFCAGASFDELISIDNLNDGKKFFSGFANVINAMRTCRQLIIGNIQGKAVGGGVGLISACDYAFATDTASIKLSELTIGIGPFVIAPAVKRKIGTNGLTELTLAATEWKTASWAKEKGMYANVFETQEELDTATITFAEKLASYNPEALFEMKKVLWVGTENWNQLLIERAEISGKLVLSDFTKKALSKFKK